MTWEQLSGLLDELGREEGLAGGDLFHEGNLMMVPEAKRKHAQEFLEKQKRQLAYEEMNAGKGEF